MLMMKRLLGVWLFGWLFGVSHFMDEETEGYWDVLTR